jgi:hypothetical protein
MLDAEVSIFKIPLIRNLLNKGDFLFPACLLIIKFFDLIITNSLSFLRNQESTVCKTETPAIPNNLSFLRKQESTVCKTEKPAIPNNLSFLRKQEFTAFKL